MRAPTTLSFRARLRRWVGRTGRTVAGGPARRETVAVARPRWHVGAGRPGTAHGGIRRGSLRRGPGWGLLTKPFTERRPAVIGAVVVATILAFVGASLFLKPSIFEGSYTVDAIFADTAGIQAGSPIVVAGVQAGKVSSVSLDHGKVKVALSINGGVRLPKDTSADIVVETVLGTKAVSLDAGPDWSRPLRPGDVITDTSTPTELLALSKTGAKLLNNSNAADLNQLLADVSQVTKGKHDELVAIIRGLNKLTTTVNARQDQVSQLIDAANTLSATLASHRHQLVQVLDHLNVVLSGLAQRRAALVKLLDYTDKMAAQTSSLVATNKAKLDRILGQLRTTLAIVGRHQVDLAQFVAYLDEALQGFSSIAWAGNQPVPWANQLVVAPSYNAVMGPCGDVARALDVVLGPDPRPCNKRYGPVASTGPSPLPSPPASPSFPGTTTGPAALEGPSAATTGPSLHMVLKSVEAR